MILFGKKDIGNLGEKLAAKHLRKNGYKIIAKNVQCGKNELDLVVKDGAFIAFVEVKTRAFDHPDDAAVRPSQAVDRAKRIRTRDAAFAYLREHPTTLCPRLDVIEVLVDESSGKPIVAKINHIEGAFDKSDAFISPGGY